MSAGLKWPDLIEIDLDERAWVLKDGRATVVDPAARNSSSGARWVLSCLGSDSHFSSAVVPGKSGYAAQILEKQLRDDGVLEEPGLVFVHGRCKTNGDLIYTAITMKQWMHYERLDKAAPDHRVIVPVAAVLYRQLGRVKDGITAIVFQHGSSFDLIVGNRNLLVGIDQIRAFSTLATDMGAGVSNVAVSLEQMAENANVSIDRVRWFCWREESVEAELEGFTKTDSIALNLQEVSNIPLEVVPQEIVKVDDHRVFRSSVTAFLSPVRNVDCINEGISKSLFMAEKSLFLVAVLLFCISAGVMWMSWQWDQQKVLAHQQTETIYQSIDRSWQSEASALLIDGERFDDRPNVKAVIDFIDALKSSSDVPDIHHVMKDVRLASSMKGMRVNSVRLERDKQGEPRIYVDGVAGSALGDTMVMVERLRTALAMRGYEADGSSNVSQGVNSGAFQVVLKWVGTGR